MEASANPIADQDRKGRLCQAKREILEIKLRGRVRDAASGRISARPASQNPLSFGQERIWFQSQVSSNEALYHIPLVAWFDGSLNVRALEASLSEVVRRHEVLRSGFENENGVPVQIILPQVDFAVTHIDLRDFAAEEQECEVRRRADLEALQPFELASPPLFRATLLKLGSTRHALLLTVHHIVWDGWSSGLLIKEVGRLYAAAVAGEHSPLAPSTIQYADFAYWHRSFMDSEDGRRQIAYWKKRLEALPELSTLPTDRPRAAKQKHRGSTHSWRLPDDASDAFRVLARERNTTLFAALLATFKTLLFHYTGQGDLAVGTTVAFRTRSELESLLGFFANALVLRTRLEDDPSFETLLGRVHEAAIGAQSNQDTPFEKLVEELAPKRGLSHNPLFQIAFVLHNLPTEKLALPGLTVGVEETSTNSAAFDLVLHVFDDQPGLRARFEYDADLFDRSTIVRMASHFDALAQNVVRRPSDRLSALSLLTSQQEQELIAQSRTTLAQAVSAPTLLHHWVDIAAETKARMAAVIAEGKDISYRELITRSNRLAHHLVNLGVGPDVPVAVALGPSVDIVVAILAILKANGAYVPIDPSYPAARIEHILADSKAVAVVTTREASAALRGASSPLVSLDDDAATIEAMPETPPAVRAKPQNLAYLIYTSGSTGAPKGVMVSHSNAVTSIMARRQYYAAPVEAYLLLSSIAFDSSVAGLFWTLFDGGRLCIPSEKTRRDPGALARIIEEQEISHILCLPSFYSALSLLLTPSHSASLECVIVAGEECKPELAAQHIERLPQVALFNEYGPTECSVWSSAHRIASDDGASRSISIGRPIPGAEAFVISASGVLAPPGVPGELFVGGEGVARGYRGRPDLTADRFTPNPFGQEGGRLYRTGDRVRLRDDGAIEFLGRIDNQVKIRGFRVEPSEIEEALLSHLSVREAVVITSGESGAATKLFAYLVLDAGREWSDLDLERHLSGRLPEYMIPTKVVLLDALPRLPNGKIDRSALPAPTSATIATRNDGPSGAVAALMKEIWREVLSLEQIHDDDDFFELGGNSLSAIQVIARVQQMLGQEISVASIFEAAGFRDFVRAVESEVTAGLMDDDLRALLDEIESAEESCAVDMILAAPLGGTHV